MNIVSNIHFVLRFFYKNLSSSVLGVMVLSVGLAMAITMFTLSKAMLWSASEFDGKSISSLSWVMERDVNNTNSRRSFNIPDFEEIEKQNTSFSLLSAYLMLSNSFHNPESDAIVKRYNSVRVSGNFFELFDEKPILGRALSPSDAEPGALPVLMISHDVWQAEFDGDVNAIGKTVFLDGNRKKIIGIMPKGFLFPVSQHLWIPSNWQWERKPGRNLSYGVNVLGLLKPSVNVDTAELELQNIAANLKQSFPKSNQYLSRIKVDSFDTVVNNDQLKTLLYALLVGSIFVLMISCANVSNLLLVRVGKRQFELVMRKMLGAKKREICLQVLLDAGVIAAVGTICAIILSSWACRFIWHLFITNYDSIPFWWNMDIDTRVVVFAIIIMLFSIFISSASPLFKILAKHNAGILKDNMRTSSGLRVGKAGNFLVGCQVAFTTVLLSMAMFFVILLQDLKDRQLPYSPEDILTTLLNVTTSAGYNSSDSVLGFYETIREKLMAIPGVESVGFSQRLVRSSAQDIEIDGQNLTPGSDGFQANANIVSKSYFDVFGAKPILGRFFTATDVSDSQPVVVVSQAFVNVHFPNDNPIGKRIRVKSPGNSWEPQNRARENAWTEWVTIVGVTPDLISRKGFDKAKESGNVASYLVVYIPQQQWVSRRMSLLLKGQGDVNTYAKSVSKIIASESLKLAPMTKYESIQDVFKRSELFATLTANVIASFGITALIMASIGLYGLVAFVSQQKMREYGIRIALGANRKHIISLVLVSSRLQLVLGLIFGLAISYALGGILEQNLSSPDSELPVETWVVFLVTSLIVSSVMLFSILIPALRAANLPPNIALRQD